MKRSIQLVLAAVLAVTGLGLATAPSGAVAPPKAKVFTVSSAPTVAAWSQAVRLQATITPKGGGTPKGGTVTFLANGTPVGTAVATARITTLTTRNLPLGESVISAQYSGDAVTAPGTTTSGPTVVVGQAPTTVSVAPTTDPVPYEDPAEIKAVVRASVPALTTRRPTGTVTFTTDTCVSATVKVNTNGVATWWPYLCPGIHEVTATYNGSDHHSTSDSTTTVTIEEPDGWDEENLDEVNEGSQVGFLAISDDGEVRSAYAQTISPTRTGRIYAVDLVGLWFSVTETAPGPLEVSIQTLDEDGNPTGSILGQGSLDPSTMTEGVGEQIHLDLDTAADVEAGTSYGLVLETPAQMPDAFGIWLVASTGEDSYPGPLRALLDGGVWGDHDDPDEDLLFRTHLGDPV